MLKFKLPFTGSGQAVIFVVPNDLLTCAVSLTSMMDQIKT
jgi:hypothetical protein